MLKAVTFTAPAHWASAIINGDWSGLELRDEQELEAFLVDNPHAEQACTCDDEPELRRFAFPIDGELLCEVLTYTYLQEEVAA